MSKISGNNKSNHSLIKLSDRYLYLIDSVREPFFIMNSQTGKFEYMSPVIEEIIGFTPEEVIKMGTDGLDMRMPAEDRAKMILFTSDLKGNKIHQSLTTHVEIRFKHKKGHYVWLCINRNFITDKNGNIKATISNVHDITKTKLLQEELKTSLENYKTLYDNAQVALFRTRISDGKLLECNEYLAKMIGYENKEECLVKHYAPKHYINQHQRKEFIKILKEKGQIQNYEAELQRLDGSKSWVHISAKIFPEHDYLEGVIKDITIFKILTPMENEILKQIMLGKSSKEIAFEYKRSIRTVEEHRSHIMKKLRAANIIELAKKVIERQ